MLLLSPAWAELSAQQNPNNTLQFSFPMNTTGFSVLQAGRMVEGKISHDKKGRLHSQQLRSKSKHLGNRRVSSLGL